MRKPLFLGVLISIISQIAWAEGPNAGPPNQREGNVGNGGEVYVDVSGRPHLRDLVESATCEWKWAIEAGNENVEFVRMLALLKDGMPIFGRAFEKNAGEVKICLMKGPLPIIPEEEMDGLTVVNDETQGELKTVAIRFNNEVYADKDLVEGLSVQGRGSLWVHEVLHSFLPNWTVQRKRKLLTFVRGLAQAQAGPGWSVELKRLLQFNSIYFVPVNAGNWDGYLSYCDSSDAARDAFLREVSLDNAEEARDLLVKSGLCPHLKNARGKTLLMYAAEALMPELVDDLLRLGAYATSKDQDQYTAFSYFFSARANHADIWSDRLRIARMLVDARCPYTLSVLSSVIGWGATGPQDIYDPRAVELAQIFGFGLPGQERVLLSPVYGEAAGKLATVLGAKFAQAPVFTADVPLVRRLALMEWMVSQGSLTAPVSLLSTISGNGNVAKEWTPDLAEQALRAGAEFSRVDLSSLLLVGKGEVVERVHSVRGTIPDLGSLVRIYLGEGSISAEERQGRWQRLKALGITIADFKIEEGRYLYDRLWELRDWQSGHALLEEGISIDSASIVKAIGSMMYWQRDMRWHRSPPEALLMADLEVAFRKIVPGDSTWVRPAERLLKDLVRSPYNAVFALLAERPELSFSRGSLAFQVASDLFYHPSSVDMAARLQIMLQNGLNPNSRVGLEWKGEDSHSKEDQWKYSYSLLGAAVRKNCYDCFVQLLGAGALIEEANSENGFSYWNPLGNPLVPTLWEKDERYLLAAVERSRDFNANPSVSSWREIPLFKAIERNSPQLVVALLRKGARVNIAFSTQGTPPDGSTPLMIAARTRAKEDFRGSEGGVILPPAEVERRHRAYLEAKRQIVRALLQNHADADAEDSQENTARYYATDKQIIKMLKDAED